jgi:mRNA-degrading endonuclease toxin of MazEF toxin-antitoxin module
MVDLRKPRSDLKGARVANASMIMTYDRRRVIKRAGRITRETQDALDQALRIHLGLTAV